MTFYLFKYFEKKGENMGVITITTCLPSDIHAKIKRLGYKMPELIRLGLIAKEGNPQLIFRLREMEEQNTKLYEKLRQYALKLYKLEGEQSTRKEVNP